MILKNLLIVGLGGFFGSMARYATFLIVDKKMSALYPWSTFTVNFLGSLFLGLILGYLMKAAIINDNARLLLAVGFCGSFTTFSTFAYDNLMLFQQKSLPAALIYTFASLIFCLIAVIGGIYVGKSI